jgi:ATP-dependent DNA helicase UvrD/PcrA
VLPLNVTYRCGRSIVDLATRYVPDFEAGPSNSEGAITSIPIEALTAAAGPGDFVLSRVNAPLISMAIKLLRAGKRTRVAGQDIGKGLVTLVKKLKARSVPDLLARIERWASKEISRLNTQLEAATNGRKATIQAKIDAINDKAGMLIAMADGAPNVEEIVSRIESLFADKGEHMIVCSSVHKAKGKEANRVFILRSTLRAGGEEDNIAYVAITRAKKELVWLTEGSK